MTITPEQLAQLHDAITYQLAKVERLFKPGAKLTLVVRHPDSEDDTSVVVTSDDLDAVIAEIRKRQRMPGHVTGGGALNSSMGEALAALARRR